MLPNDRSCLYCSINVCDDKKPDKKKRKKANTISIKKKGERVMKKTRLDQKQNEPF